MNTVINRPATFATSRFGRYRRELHRYLTRRLRRPQDVDDVAQEVYLRLLKLDDERVVHKPLAYLYGIAAHVLTDFRLHDNEVADAMHYCDPDEDWAEQPSCALPDDLADRLNLQQQINKALAQLPATQAAVLLYHKRDGLSYTEVAERLGISPFTVEKYLTLAKAKIRTMTWER